MSSKTYVDSVVYSMSGDPDTIPNYLQSIVVGGLISRQSNDFSKRLNEATINGPGMRMRTFFRWAKKRTVVGTFLPGIPTDGLIQQGSVSDPAVVEALDDYINGYVAGSLAPYIAIYAYAKSEDYVMNEAILEFWAEYPSDYMYSNVYITQNENVVTFVVMDWVPDQFGDLNERYRVSYTIDNTHEGDIYRVYQTYLTNGHNHSVAIPYRDGGDYPELEVDVTVIFVDNEYFPMLPLRINKQMINDPSNSWFTNNLYPQVKLGYKKAFGSDISELLTNLEDNESLGDIDFAFTVVAAALDTPYNASKDFLFGFAKDLYIRWSRNQRLKAFYVSSPAFMYPPGSSDNERRAIQLSLHWTTMSFESGTGLAWSGAKSGKAYVYGGTGVKPEHGSSTITYDNTAAYFVKQLTANTWERVCIREFKQFTHVYNGVNVEYDARSVFDEPDPDEVSSFLVPVSYQVFEDLSLVTANQLALECNQIVFNSYKVVKKKWYQTGLFKLVLIVAIVVLTVVTGGVGAGTVGLLGTNIAVGTALGMAGMAAVIAGAVANAIAAQILIQLVSYGVSEVFGAEIAMIVSVIASIYTLSIGNLSNMGASLSSMVTRLMQPQNLLALTSVVGNTYAQSLGLDTMKTQLQTNQLIADYTKQAKEISDKERELFGTGSTFNPLDLVGAPTFLAENSSTFLGRTLLTGTDIAELSNNLLSNFADASLSIELA